MTSKEKTFEQSKAIKITGIGYWILVFAFAMFFSPKSYAVSASVFRAWRIVETGVSLVAILLYVVRERISLRWVFFMIFLFCYYILSTFINRADGKFSTAAYYSISVAGFVTLLEYGMNRDREACLSAFLTAGIIMCGVHYLTFLRYRRFPLGMRSSTFDIFGELTRHPWFFLTHDNGSVFYFIPVIGGLWYRAISYKKGLIQAIVFTVATLYMYWSLNTVTGKIVTTFLTVCIVVVVRFGCIRPFRFLSYRSALLIGFGICIAVILFYTSDILVQIATALGKSSDLGRGRIWQRAWPIIWDSPVIGVGFENDSTTAFRLGINHCHNIIVQILYTGGLIAFVSFLFSIFKYDNLHVNTISEDIVALSIYYLTIIMLLVCATFDWYLYMPIQFFPFIASHYPNVVNDEVLSRT